MRGTRTAAAATLAAGLVFWAGRAHAGDTMRLNRTGNDDAPVQTLQDHGARADTVATRHFGGFGGFHRGFGGFHRGFGGFGRGFGGFGRGFGGFGRGWGWGGYRGFGGFRRFGYGGYGLGYGGLGFGLGYLLGSGLGYGGYGGYGYGGYSPYYGGYYGGYYPSYGGYYGSYYPYYGCSYTVATPAYYTLGGSVGAPSVNLSIAPSGYVPYGSGVAAPAAPPPTNGTYPYDGGPRVPVPMPGVAPEPTRTRPATVPLEGRVVSLPKKSKAKWTYPAYGEKPRRGQSDETIAVKDELVRRTGR